jgi:plastocyanin
VVACLLALAVACGSDEEVSGGDGTDEATQEPTPTAEAGGGGDETTLDLTVVAIPNCVFTCFAFEPKTLKVPAAALITINIANETDSTHNLRIDGEDHGYDTPDDAISEPAALEAGTAGTTEWTSPAKQGTYRFRCDFHPSYPRMTGGITVE